MKFVQIQKGTRRNGGGGPPAGVITGALVGPESAVAPPMKVNNTDRQSRLDAILAEVDDALAA